MTDSSTKPRSADREDGAASFCSHRTILLSLGLVLLTLFVRKTDAFLNPQFWAEDSIVFFYQARYDGLSALFDPYSGYLHLLPRLIAAASSGFPASFAPAVYLFASVVFTLAAALAIFSPRLDLPCRPLLALALVLVPHNGEVFLNITNLQWVLAPGLLLLLLARDPANLRQWAFDATALTLLGLTGPFIMLWLPLFLLRAKVRRSRASVLLAALATIVALGQVHAYLQDHPPVQSGAVLVEQLFRLQGTRFWGPMLMPGQWALQLGSWAGSLLAASVTFGVVWLVISKLRLRTERLFLLAAAGLIISSTLYKFHGNLGILNATANGDRYFYIPRVIILWLLVMELAGDGWRRWFGIGFLALSALSSATAFRARPMTDYDWPAWAARIDADENITVPVNPPGWSVHFPPRRSP